MVDFRVRSVTQASRTTVGTQDFTVSGFGTATAWVVTVSHTGNGALIGVGFGTFDGVSTYTNGWAGAAATDGDATSIWASDSDAAFEAQALNHLGPTITTEILEADAALITDGIRLTYTTAPASALSVRVDLIQCDGAFVGSENLANAAPTASVTGFGFQPNAMLVVHSGGLSVTAGYRPCFGFAARDSLGVLRQASVMMASGSNNAPADVRQHLDSTRGLAFITGASAKSSWTIDSFDADGFTYSDSQGANNITVQYLALRSDTQEFWCGFLDTPTATGVEAYAEPGFGAGGLWVVPTFAATLDSTLVLGGCGTVGFGVFNGTEQGCASASTEDGVNPSNTSSEASTTQGLLAKADAGTTGYAGVVSSSGSGFSVDFAVVDATPRYFLALVWSGADLFESTDETLALTEQVLAASFAPVDETLGILEEVVYVAFDALPEESDVTGEGGFQGVVQGQVGMARVIEGQGGHA